MQGAQRVGLEERVGVLEGIEELADDRSAYLGVDADDRDPELVALQFAIAFPRANQRRQRRACVGAERGEGPGGAPEAGLPSAVVLTSGRGSLEFGGQGTEIAKRLLLASVAASRHPDQGTAGSWMAPVVIDADGHATLPDTDAGTRVGIASPARW